VTQTMFEKWTQLYNVMLYLLYVSKQGTGLKYTKQKIAKNIHDLNKLNPKRCIKDNVTYARGDLFLNRLNNFV